MLSSARERTFQEYCNVPQLALHWPSVRTPILYAFSAGVSKAISGNVLRSMISSGSMPSLIEQCRYLEQPTRTNYTDKILTGSDFTMSNREIREELLKQDITLCKSAASEYASPSF